MKAVRRLRCAVAVVTLAVVTLAVVTLASGRPCPRGG
jgi:hypothetical protein